jgi:hypothetical protein
MIEFAGQDAVAAAVSGQKNDVASGQFAGEQIVRGRPNGVLTLTHFWRVNPSIVKAGAADDADARFQTWRIFNRETFERHEKSNEAHFPGGGLAEPPSTTFPGWHLGNKRANLMRWKYFQRILKTAVEGGASDVHLKIGTPVIFRINRELVAVDSPFPTSEWMNKIVEAITPAHLKKKLEEEREVDFSYFIPGTGRFPHESVPAARPMVSGHALRQDARAELRGTGPAGADQKIAESPRGIVLVAGSTGCGKSTTLAAMIEHINNNFKKHIITLEDPIEYVFEDNQSVIEQREIGLDTVSFHHALKCTSCARTRTSS